LPDKIKTINMDKYVFRTKTTGMVQYWQDEKEMEPMPEPTIQELVARLETRVAELERQRRIQEDRDISLLARVDDFTDDLRRIERIQLRGFEEQRAHQEYVTERFEHVEARLDTVEDHLTKLIEAAVIQKEAIEALYVGQQSLIAGQEQILLILAGKPKTND
jgi:hypothetical protein